MVPGGRHFRPAPRHGVPVDKFGHNCGEGSFLRSISGLSPKGHGSSFYSRRCAGTHVIGGGTSQIVQTIEMFEVITQTQPDDYQSLEILKEAYHKIGKPEESLRISRRLAEAYFNVGSYTLAMQECEVILVKEPNAPEILAMLGEIETRLQAAGHEARRRRREERLDRHGRAERQWRPERHVADRRCRQTRRRAHGSRTARSRRRSAREIFDRATALRRGRSDAALETVKHLNKDLSRPGAGGFACSTNFAGRTRTRLDAVLSALIDRTKFAYVPLEYYDVDRQIARMLPDNLTLGPVVRAVRFDQPHDHGRVLQSV